MKEQFVTFNIASKLKELGFDEPCLGLYYKIDTDNGKDWLLDFPRLDYKDNKHSSILELFNTNENCITVPLWQQVIEWLKVNHKILITELWDGWEVGVEDDDFVFYSTKTKAFLKAINLIKKP